MSQTFYSWLFYPRFRSTVLWAPSAAFCQCSSVSICLFISAPNGSCFSSNKAKHPSFVWLEFYLKGSLIFYILHLWWFYLLLKLLSGFVSDFVVVVVRLAVSYDCCPVSCHLYGAALCQVTSCNSFCTCVYWFTTKQRSLLILSAMVLIDSKTAVCFFRQNSRAVGMIQTAVCWPHWWRDLNWINVSRKLPQSIYDHLKTKQNESPRSDNDL